MVQIELVYPAIDKIYHFELSLPEGATIADALQQAGLALTHPEVEELTTGIFSKVARSDTVLKAGDRVEIYRPLTSCPKSKRRLRARKKIIRTPGNH